MNTVKQIDLAVTDEPGALSAVSELLGANGITLIAFHMGTGGDTGRCRFIANDPEKALNVLKTSGYALETRDVIACEMPRHPGGLNAVLKPLEEAGINIEYLYPCMGTGEGTVLVVGTGAVDETLALMRDNWIKTLGEELYHI